MVVLISLCSTCVSSSAMRSSRNYISRMSTQTAPALVQTSLQLPSGLCAVYKPKGRTSNEIVGKVKYIINTEASKRLGSKVKVKVGHGGTLDPMAEGVLVLGLGAGTKLMGSYLSGSKGYRAGAILGSEMDTLDITGSVTNTVDCSHITMNDLQSALAAFRGDIKQLPPMYSALRQNGKRLYELARQGIEVERELRDVTVYRLHLLSEGFTLPEFGLGVECSGGFYVRSLIADLCSAVGGAGCMSSLVRTKQGAFTLDHCLSEEEWTLDNIVQHTTKCSQFAGIPVAEMRK